jgi:prevent-host-death family protein
MKSRSVTAKVKDSRTAVTITKRGKPVATVQPAEKPWKSLEGILKGKIDLDALGDIVSPPAGIYWEALDGHVDPPCQRRVSKPRKSA